MRAFVRIAVGAALAVTLSFIWTVGQTGLDQTNQHLCELWSRLPLPAYSSCNFQNVLVYIWLAGAVTGGGWLLIEFLGLKSIRRLIGTRMIFIGLVVIVAGLIIAGYGLWGQQSNPSESIRPDKISVDQMRAPAPSGQIQKTVDRIGSTFSLQLAQLLRGVQPPCILKITDSSDSELAGVIRWVADYGNIPSGKICDILRSNKLPSADLSYVKPTTDPGMVIHWKSEYTAGERVAHWFGSTGLKVSTSHQLDGDAPNNLIWIDIGPGSPWK